MKLKTSVKRFFEAGLCAFLWTVAVFFMTTVFILALRSLAFGVFGFTHSGLVSLTVAFFSLYIILLVICLDEHERDHDGWWSE
jgi:hypothetical protein